MKFILVATGLIFVLLTGKTSFGEEEKDLENQAPKAEKKFTQEEFDQKLNELVKKKLGKVMGGNISTFSEELFAKEKKLNQLEVELKKREEQLEMNQKSLADKIKELELKQEEFLACTAKTQEEQDSRLGRLVEMVSGMRPAQAAEVLSVQEVDIAVQVIGKIDAKRAAKIFNLMDKEVSARLQKQFLTMKR